MESKRVGCCPDYLFICSVLGVGMSATEFHLAIITRRNILDVAPFHIAMLRIREDNSFVPESTTIWITEKLLLLTQVLLE